MSKTKENKEQIWLEKFDYFSITGKDSKRFLNGITTGNIVDLKNKVLKTCWLSPNGILKSLLEINCLENKLELIVFVGNTSEIRKYFNDIIFLSDDVSLSDTFSINRLQQVDDINSWRITQPIFFKNEDKKYDFYNNNPNSMNTNDLQLWKINQAIPSLNSEINGKNNPLELGLTDLIDFNKGCYLGQETMSKIYLTVVGKYITPSRVYLSSTRESIYARTNRIHSFVGGLEAKKYAVVYPFIKTREWYLLPLEQRKQMMDEHIKISQKYPQVELNTTYSFGIHDQDFMLAFESDDLNIFQDMIMELRGTKVSAFVKEDTPMIVCVKKDIVPIITSLG